MKERPILFNGDMVRAILSSTKTQTRRVAKPSKDRELGCDLAVCELAGEVNGGDYTNSPYGQPGDRLWVRETWNRTNPGGAEGVYYHRADTHFPASIGGGPIWTDTAWRPSIHMPRAACRLELEITAVRVERLQSITVGDAIAEGCPGGEHGDRYAAVEQYRALWESINGAGSWSTNPWVWVIEFKRLEDSKK